MEIMENSIPSLALIHFIIQNSSRSKNMNKANDPHVSNETSAIMVLFHQIFVISFCISNKLIGVVLLIFVKFYRKIHYLYFLEYVLVINLLNVRQCRSFPKIFNCRRFYTSTFSNLVHTWHLTMK